VTSVVRSGRPFTQTRIAERGAIEAAKLALGRLERVSDRSVERSAAPELEHVGRQGDVELPTVSPQIAHPDAHSAVLARLPRLHRGDRSARGIDRRLRHEDGTIRFVAEIQPAYAAEVRVHHSGLREIVRHESADPEEPATHAGVPVERRAPAPRHIVRRIDQRHPRRPLGQHSAAADALGGYGVRIRREERPVRSRCRSADAVEERRASSETGGRRRICQNPGMQ